ncbi:MAG: phosphoribosylaminoimidazole carboxylase-related protein [Ilumatobacteraceae bacterium]|nr:phosphoribosylaminoimidazole carboxylase-related protein [Ilumatobacteraceae bacterium]
MLAVNEADIRQMLDAVRTGSLSPDEAVATLRRLPFADVGDALVDHHRSLRQGMPEAVYGPGKSPEQVVRIVGELLSVGSDPVLVTRASVEQDQAVTLAHGEPERVGTSLLWRRPHAWRFSNVLVVSAGTADQPVVDECLITLGAHGFVANHIADVGVAGIHRLLARLDDITAADAIIVVAGMEGALASVIGGLSRSPIVAVPTSVGYGSGLDGVTALLAMHASCASGITVVGIDNGFGAACAIARMMQ